jgi:hypothetical protein
MPSRSTAFKIFDDAKDVLKALKSPRCLFKQLCIGRDTSLRRIQAHWPVLLGGTVQWLHYYRPSQLEKARNFLQQPQHECGEQNGQEAPVPQAASTNSES